MVQVDRGRPGSKRHQAGDVKLGCHDELHERKDLQVEGREIVGAMYVVGCSKIQDDQ